MTLLDAPLSSTRARATAESGTFPAADGENLFYRRWPAKRDSERCLILLHRGHEHSGRFENFLQRLDLPDLHVFAWDARGHGESPGERGYAPNFATIIDDLNQFANFIRREFELKLENAIVLGHSVGAIVAAAWVHDYAPPIRAMILATPAFRIKLYVPLALPALRIRNRFGKSFIKSYVRPAMLTHDPRQAESYKSDPLISRNIATNILLDVHDTSTRLLANAPAIRTPSLILSAGSDWVVKNSAQKKFFEKLGSPIKQFVAFKDFHHAILHERDRDRPIAKIREFIVESFDRSAETTIVEWSDEFESVSKPLPIFSAKRWNFFIQRLGMKTLGRLSAGVRLGWRTGFDSGESLDYVYENTPRGFTPFGKFIDRQYLNAIGWRGIRLRKTHLQNALRERIESLSESSQPIHILDIAAGAGRYVLETMRDLQTRIEISAILRDRSDGALAAARQTSASWNLKNVAIENGDAFDAQSLASISPRATIAIVSGLYELFPSNDLIRASLDGLSRAVSPRGFLIYTNQPWHPQIEMIARVLINRDGKPWIMRRRSQAEMDALVAAAGFEKIDMKIDPFGIFTVSIARKISR